jgi:SAM-dependent methyltransferase
MSVSDAIALAAGRLIYSLDGSHGVRLRCKRMQRPHPFIDSPELYDAVYHFKDYRSECDRLRSVINQLLPNARGILDVACGTGEHARFLKEHYAIDGIDINENYLRAARLKNPSGKYARADMLDFDLGQTYDIVICLFSAIGIVGTFVRLERAIACMAGHVRPGGALIVEPWFTPEEWRPGRQLILAGQIGTDKVYRMSTGVAERQSSVLLYHYLRSTPNSLEHYTERVELGLFTRDEMTWAFESAGMQVRYDSAGLIGRGLYCGQHNSQISNGMVRLSPSSAKESPWGSD